jgi:hypothetical protein
MIDRTAAEVGMATRFALESISPQQLLAVGRKSHWRARSTQQILLRHNFPGAYLIREREGNTFGLTGAAPCQLGWHLLRPKRAFLIPHHLGAVVDRGKPNHYVVTRDPSAASPTGFKYGIEDGLRYVTVGEVGLNFVPPSPFAGGVSVRACERASVRA